MPHDAKRGRHTFKIFYFGSSSTCYCNFAIKFGTPAEWVKYAETNKSEGRGDLLEGVFASAKLGNRKANIHYTKKYADVSVKYHPGYKLNYYRKNDSMVLPTFCFYILTTEEFSEKKQSEIYLSKNIPPNYFRDFADYKSPEEIEEIPEDERPALVWITKPDEFLNRIYNALFDIGVKEEEIINRAICYKKLTKEFKPLAVPPEELTFKDIRFKNQSEARIIINITNSKILTYLHENPILIGDISDISQKLERYMYDGGDIEFPLKDIVRKDDTNT